MTTTKRNWTGNYTVSDGNREVTVMKIENGDSGEREVLWLVEDESAAGSPTVLRTKSEAVAEAKKILAVSKSNYDQAGVQAARRARARS